MRNVIIITKDKEPIGAWGSITEISRIYDWVRYESIKARKFPFKYKGHEFHKLKFRNRTK